MLAATRKTQQRPNPLPAKQPIQPEPWTLHLLGLVNPALVIAGNVLGDSTVLLGVVFMLVIGPCLDWACGETRAPKPPSGNGEGFEGLLRAHAILQLIAVGTLLYRAGLDGPAWTTWVAALSTGLCSGASGIIVAHELGHRRRSWLLDTLRRFCLGSALYGHFTTEHNHTHHKHVATTADPATARRGESLWAFVVRTIPAQFIGAWIVHERKGRSGLRNPVGHGLVTALAGLSILYGAFGLWTLCAFLVQAGFAVFLLEYINYIRHYGLERQPGERVRSDHAWQSEARWSRWTLLELTRHPAHHLRASSPYWQLRPYTDSPSLPSGYYGCFWLAVIPPLWRRIVHSRIPPASEKGKASLTEPPAQ